PESGRRDPSTRKDSPRSTPPASTPPAERRCGRRWCRARPGSALRAGNARRPDPDRTACGSPADRSRARSDRRKRNSARTTPAPAACAGSAPAVGELTSAAAWERADSLADQLHLVRRGIDHAELAARDLLDAARRGPRSLLQLQPAVVHVQCIALVL